jgi:hypothetical protein
MDPRLILSIICMSVGAIFGIASLYLLFKQKPVLDASGNVTEVDIPLFGKLKTNYPSLAGLFIASFLVWFPLHKWPAPLEVKRIPVSGKITLKGKASYGGVIVGVVPGNVVRLRDDGSYDLDVLEGERSYTGVAYYDGQGSKESKDIYLGGVSVAMGKGTFNAVLGRQP